MMLVKHSLIYLFARGGPAVINLLALLLYTRLLEPDAYGTYAIVFTTMLLAHAVLFQWLRLALVRFLPAEEDDGRALLAVLLRAFAMMALLSLGVGSTVLVAFWDEATLRVPIILGTLLVVAYSWHEMTLDMSHSQLRPLRYALLACGRAVLGLGIGAVLAWQGWGASGLLLGQLGGAIIPALVAPGLPWRGLRLPLDSRRRPARIAAYGLPLTAGFAMSFVIQSSDRLLLGWLVGAGPAGLYAVGYDLAKQAVFLPMVAVNLAAFPLALRALESGDAERCREQLGRNLALLLGISAPLAAGLVLLAPNIAMTLLRGTEFQETTARLLPLVAVATLVAGFKSFYIDLSFHLSRRTVRQVWTLAAAAVVNVVLNIFWIPGWGLMGAASATLVAYLVATGLGFCLGRSLFRLPPPGKDAGLALLGTVAMVASLWAVHEYRGVLALVAQVSLGASSYLMVMLAGDFAGLRSWTLRQVVPRGKVRA